MSCFIAAAIRVRPLDDASSFGHIASLLQVSSEERLHYPALYARARQRFQDLFPTTVEHFVHPENPEEALRLAIEHDIQPVSSTIIPFKYADLSYALVGPEAFVLQRGHNITFRARRQGPTPQSASECCYSLCIPPGQFDIALYAYTLYRRYGITHGMHRHVCREVDATGDRTRTGRQRSLHANRDAAKDPED